MPSNTIEGMGSAFIQQLDIPPTAEGPLSGLTFAVKDALDVAGTVTGCGNPTWAARQTPTAVHAVAVELLLGAGARCVGKTVMDEFAFSLVGENHFYGTPPNPRAPDRVPGGSSSGSASAVAAGLVDFALGTDTAGSIRVPAANCGILGLRPTWGALSVAGLQALAPSFDTVGIFAREADVLRRVAQCLYPPTPHQSTKTIFMLKEAWDIADPEIRDRRPQIEAELRAAGLQVEATTLMAWAGDELGTDFFAWKRLFSAVQWPEVWSTFGSWMDEVKPEMGPRIADNFALARGVDRTALVAAVKRRNIARCQLQFFLLDGAALGLPTTSSPPPRRGEVDYDRTGTGYLPRTLCLTGLAGIGGLPQVSLPLATTEGLPMGFSLVGAAGSDFSLLELAAQVHAALVELNRA